MTYRTDGAYGAKGELALKRKPFLYVGGLRAQALTRLCTLARTWGAITEVMLAAALLQDTIEDGGHRRGHRRRLRLRGDQLVIALTDECHQGTGQSARLRGPRAWVRSRRTRRR